MIKRIHSSMIGGPILVWTSPDWDDKVWVPLFSRTFEEAIGEVHDAAIEHELSETMDPDDFDYDPDHKAPTTYLVGHVKELAQSRRIYELEIPDLLKARAELLRCEWLLEDVTGVRGPFRFDFFGLRECPTCKAKVGPCQVACSLHTKCLPSELQKRVRRLRDVDPESKDYQTVIREVVASLTPASPPESLVRCPRCNQPTLREGPCEDHDPCAVVGDLHPRNDWIGVEDPSTYAWSPFSYLDED